MIILWYIPFWALVAVALILAAVAAAMHKLQFIDIQIVIMIIALAMASDMLFCKQYELYTYVDVKFKGWYSFWANLIIIPALGLVFVKFIPKSLKMVGVYIVVWTVMATLFEILITEPLGILIYSKWRIFPYSTIGYVIAFTWEYIYYRMLLKYCR